MSRDTCTTACALGARLRVAGFSVTGTDFTTPPLGEWMSPAESETFSVSENLFSSWKAADARAPARALTVISTLDSAPAESLKPRAFSYALARSRPNARAWLVAADQYEIFNSASRVRLSPASRRGSPFNPEENCLAPSVYKAVNAESLKPRAFSYALARSRPNARAWLVAADQYEIFNSASRVRLSPASRRGSPN